MKLKNVAAASALALAVATAPALAQDRPADIVTLNRPGSAGGCLV